MKDNQLENQLNNQLNPSETRCLSPQPTESQAPLCHPPKCPQTPHRPPQWPIVIPVKQTS